MSVAIVPYAPHHAAAFRDLNLAWIERHFVVEATDRARAIGAATLYLETNAGLGPAIRLYERAGFRHLGTDARPATPYARCNGFMRMLL